MENPIDSVVQTPPVAAEEGTSMPAASQDDADQDVWKGLGWKPAAPLPREDPPLEEGEPDWDVPRFGSASWTFAQEKEGCSAAGSNTPDTRSRMCGASGSAKEVTSQVDREEEAQDAMEVTSMQWQEEYKAARLQEEEACKASSLPSDGTQAEQAPGSKPRSASRSGSADRPGKALKASRQPGGATATANGKQLRSQGSSTSAAPLIGTLLTEEAVGVRESDEDVPLAPVSVCIRVRPLLDWEKQKGEVVGALQVQDGKAGQIVLTPTEELGKNGPKNFRFDAVFGGQRSQQDVWELAQMRKLVNKVVDGFHATVFAYGQTGSGKTHTMEGFVYDHQAGDNGPTVVAAKPRVRVKETPPEQLGIVPRAVTGLFSQIGREKTQTPSEEFVVKVSFLQIYNERIFDLLNPVKDLAVGEEDRGLRLRWQENKQQFYVENLFEYECATADDVLKHYCNGVRNKHMASTAMNVASSRSHAVLVLSCVRRSPVGGEKGDQTNIVYKEVVSKLSFVDLAGSERASASTGEGESSTRAARFQEAVNINQSLFVLRKVIMALSKQPEGGDNSHVPYRESKLTSMLRHSIGGNSYMVMLACISPADKHFEENLSTLQYAARAACIKNEPMMNLDPKDAMIQALQQQLEAAHAWIRKHTGSETLPDELLKLGEPQTQQRHRSAARASGQRRAVSNPPRHQNSLANSMDFARGSPEELPRPSMSSTMRPSSTKEGTVGHQPRKNSSESAVQLDQSIPVNGSAVPSTLPPVEAMASPRGYESSNLPGRFGRSPANKKRRPPSLPPSSSRPLLPVPGPLLSQGTQGTLPPVPSGGGYKKPLDPEKVERYAAYLEHQTTPGSRKPRKKKLGATASQWSETEAEGCSPHGTTGDVSGRARSGSVTPSTMTPPSSTEESAGTVADLEEHLREAVQANAVLEGRCDNLWTFKEELEQKNEQLSQLMMQMEEDAKAHRAAEKDVRVGLWEAMEELRRGKDGLESQVQNLEDAIQIAKEEAAECERENERVCAANEKLAAQLRQLERGRASAAVGSPSALEKLLSVPDVPNVDNAPSAEHEAELEKLRAENKELREAREKLEVFEKALELSTLEESNQPSDDADEATGGENDKLAEKVVRLHSNLVLEASTLRKDIAGLKKKKWVIQSVLNNGGEREEKAIQREIDEIKNTKRSSVGAVATPRSIEVR